MALFGRLDFKEPPTAVGGILGSPGWRSFVGWTLRNHQLPLVEFSEVRGGALL
jgi:hypothetical protein